MTFLSDDPRIRMRERGLHAGILQMAMDDPLYAEVWRPLNPPGDFNVQRQHMYVNLVVSQWELEYDLARLSDDHLRAIAVGVFSTDPGRLYWPIARPVRLTTEDGLRGRRRRCRQRFHRVLDEAYAAANPGWTAGQPAPSPA